MVDAAGAVLFAEDLSADEVGAGLRDVVSIFKGEIDRRISGWTGADPEVPTEEKDMELSDQDKAAVVLAKAGRGNPALRERIRKTDEARAATHPVEKAHPIEEMSKSSPVLSEIEHDVLEIMSKHRVSHEVALGRLAADPGYHSVKARYRVEQRAMRGE
jgi:hypothetical protein